MQAIQGSSPMEANPSPALPEGEGNVQQLEREKAQIQDEIKRLKGDRNQNPEEKKKKLEKLEQRLEKVERQIAEAKQTQRSEETQAPDSQKSENTKVSNAPVDRWVREGEQEEAIPGLYYIEGFENGKPKIAVCPPEPGEDE